MNKSSPIKKAPTLCSFLVYDWGLLGWFMCVAVMHERPPSSPLFFFAQAGGGLFVDYGGTATLTTSPVTGNIASVSSNQRPLASWPLILLPLGAMTNHPPPHLPSLSSFFSLLLLSSLHRLEVGFTWIMEERRL